MYKYHFARAAGAGKVLLCVIVMKRLSSGARRSVRLLSASLADEREYWQVDFHCAKRKPRADSPNTREAQLSLKRSPTRLPTNYPTTGTWNYGAPIG
jgi:hypothetical protein